jgi:hypothetical protein
MTVTEPIKKSGIDIPENWRKWDFILQAITRKQPGLSRPGKMFKV